MSSTQHPDLPRIPGYAVEMALGSGGMATVYRARQLALDRPVAIKVLRAYGREASELMQRFEQEAKLIAALDHPNIVAIYEVTRTEDGDACYVMPLFEHGDLASRPKPMAESEIRRVLLAVLDALGHAHAKGVVHRDVKPANVLFDARGKPLLADFGVALKVQSRERLTSHGRTVGSSETMSPEQARGDPVDGRSDLYSVGCLAFELLTGYPPFTGDDFLQVALRHQQEPVPRLPQRLAHWQPFIDCALAKTPDQRYADAAAMSAALESIAHAPARPSPRPAAPSPALLGVAALLLVAIAVGVWWVLRDPEDLASVPVVDGVAIDAADTLGRVDSAIRTRRWFDGSGDSADALLLPLFASEPVDADALDLRDRLLDQASAALGAVDDARLAEQLPHWSAFVQETQATGLPPVQALVDTLEARWRPALEAARSARDRALAAREVQLAAMLPRRSPAFAELSDLVAGFPASGIPFRDGDGPELLLIPGARVAGIPGPFAVTRFEIARSDYLLFVEATGRRSAVCRDGGRSVSWREPGFPQAGNEPVVCVSHGDAVAYAAWLSQRSGRKYRLPTAAEWRGLNAAARADNCANLRGENPPCADSFRNTAPGGRFASAPGMPSDLAGNVREWTSDCEYQKVGAVKRLGTSIGNLFRKDDKDTGKLVCVGRLALGSGWRDGELDRAASVESADSAAVDRGFRLIREIR